MPDEEGAHVFDLSVISLLFNVGVGLLNVFALGVFTGYLTRRVLQIRPASWSERYTRFVLWLAAITVLVSDVLLILEAID